MIRFSKKGSIIVSFIFIIILTITAASYFIMTGGRSAFTANQLKRAQAINCAEAALYETFNRIRAGERVPDSDFTDRVDVYVADPADPSTTYYIVVDIDYDYDYDDGDPATLINRVKAKVHYDHIRM